MENFKDVQLAVMVDAGRKRICNQNEYLAMRLSVEKLRLSGGEAIVRVVNIRLFEFL